MILLLDTHVLLWWDEGRPLDRAATRAIESADLVYVSAVSGWEIAIKASLGRIRPRRTTAEAIEASGFVELPVTLRHGEALAALPWHHRDPFDRMLAAQAHAEGATLLTRDPAFEKYDVRVLRA